ncbi:MAG TPA: hypothetical protein VHA52_06805 [Candidatus Babeliaceae bacterium]|nr:hypothetical protein [Candidatus Babeliaceae bacterium]
MDDYQVVMFSGDTRVPVDIVKAAVAHYRQPQKGYRSQTSMENRYPFLRTKNDFTKLRKFETDEEACVARKHQLARLWSTLRQEVLSKFAQGISLHDKDLQKIALELNRNLHISGFKASPRWITKFKQANRIVSRRVTRIVSRQALANRSTLAHEVNKFVLKVRALQFPPQYTVNADQSPCQIEMSSARSLAIEGERTVERAAQAVSNTTHSYTIMPMVYADGHLSRMLYVVLPERKKKFPASFVNHTTNLIVRCHSSHIMTKELMLDWVRVCVVPEIQNSLLLVLDSWAPFKNHEKISEQVPRGKSITVMNIPSGCTRIAQPLDVFFFRILKEFIRDIHKHISVCSIPFQINNRDNILFVLEAVWHQFCNPVFKQFNKYAWRKIGYVEGPKEQFKTPRDICFKEMNSSDCEVSNCSGTPLLKCSYCDRCLCFEDFIVKRHRC